MSDQKAQMVREYKGWRADYRWCGPDRWTFAAILPGRGGVIDPIREYETAKAAESAFIALVDANTN